MRVLFLSQIVPYPPHGGVLQRGYNVLRQLGQQAEVHLLAFVHPEALPTPDTLEQSKIELSRFCRRVEYFPLWAKRSPAHRVLALTASVASSEPFGAIAHRSSAFRQRIGEAVRQQPFDVVHADTIGLAGFVDLDAPPAATVLTHHNVESMLMARRSEVERGRAARTFLRREAAKLEAAERRLSPRFDVNIVMSENDGESLRALAPSARTRVVANGVDTEYFTPAEDGGAPVLIYGGGMNMFANRDAVLHFLRAVWPLVKVAEPAVRFLAVGQDPPPELTALAAQDPQIVVTGYVADIRPYIAQATVYVVPLRVGGGTRLKVLDAMAMGKAMVSTTLGCEGLAVTAGEHLLVADAPPDFAAAVVSLLRDRPRRVALGQAARTLVEREYAWPAIGRQLMAAYDDAVTHRAERS